MTDDLCDYAALERMWTNRSWFAYVGRTRQQREGMKPLRVRRGPRGLVVMQSGTIRTRSTFSGEFQCR